MANRDLDFSPSVTNVVPENVDTGTIVNAVADIGNQVAQQSAQTKALQATAQTQLAFRQLDTKFRLANAGDPTNPQALQDLQAARQSVIDNIGQGVPSIVMRDYTNKAIELGQASDASNQLWTTQQQVKNTKSQIQTAYETSMQEANQSGIQFAQQGNLDLSTALNYVHSNEAIRQFATPVLGEEVTGKYLKSFNTDYVKAFVSGVAEHDPQRAAALLEDPNIQDHFSTEDRGDMADLIKKTTRQQELIQSLQQTKGDGGLTDIVNDPNATYFEKRAQIDQLDMSGSISPKAASAARRVIKSSADLDAQTDTPVMTDILNQTYDLNATAKTKPSDYLVGVQDIHQKIINAQANGDLTAQDASKITKEVNNLMSSRLSDATTNVAGKFSDARKQFEKALPPEFRGDAVRQLFYATNGQNMTSQQVSNQAGAIIDKINKQRLQNTQSILSKIGDDSAFLKTLGYTPEQVQTDAAAKGMSYQQGIQALRSKYSSKSKRMPKAVSNPMAEDDGTDSSAGIRLNGAPPATLLNENEDGSSDQ